MDTQTPLMWHALLLAAIWVPFAVAAGLVDTWRTEGGRSFRARAVHPLRTVREYRLLHAPAHVH